jgi:hypothetical protein
MDRGVADKEKRCGDAGVGATGGGRRKRAWQGKDQPDATAEPERAPASARTNGDGAGREKKEQSSKPKRNTLNETAGGHFEKRKKRQFFRSCYIYTMQRR